MRDLHDYSLLAHNTFGIDASCRRYIEYATADEARQVAAMLQGSPYIIIGGGSNLLLTGDYDGTVVRSAIRGIEPLGGGRVRCGSGEVWDDVVAWCVDHGLWGAENLSLIPGDVGASAVQNIGAYGVEAKDLIVEVEAVEIPSGREVVMGNADCRYGYRDSQFKHEWKNRYLITHVTYQLTPADLQPELHTQYGNIAAELAKRGMAHPTAAQLRQVIIDIRNAKLPDPKVTGNAGSFFMNPVVSRAKYLQLAAQYEGMPHYTLADGSEKIPAGWMIEQCGWKGRSLGRAGVHDKQALVLVNRGGATGSEIVSLCEAIRHDVRDKFGIDIRPEVNII
ncbi:MAG: UDP-N-acetylmuramate dehydrogenase [Prevotella sp.]|nr:UDP-N-acetylmuramate dehydrogenase [Prevotella sp.]